MQQSSLHTLGVDYFVVTAAKCFMVPPPFRHGYGITAKLGVFSGLRFRSMQDFHTCVSVSLDFFCGLKKLALLEVHICIMCVIHIFALSSFLVLPPLS